MLKRLEKAAENEEKKRGVFEEWPKFPHESWRWSLSPPAKELEKELIVIIKRYLLLGESSIKMASIKTF